MAECVGVIYYLKDPESLKIRYIGQTIQGIDLRLKQHLWYSSKQNNHLGCWLRSLSADPIIDIIEECEFESLDTRELYWIDYYKENNLVNSMIRCERSRHHTHSEETKKKIGLATIKTHTGRKRSEETRLKISEAAKARDNKYHPNMHSKEAIKKRIAKVSKPVLQFTKSGEFIKEWESGAVAARELNLNKGNLNSCCNEKVKSCGGYVWKFKH